jgi:uncharacterized protein YjbI with pentapeptide repeats
MSIEPELPYEWSDTEKWAWGKICSGNIADFNKRYQDYNLITYKPDGWYDENKDRFLSGAFLKTILTEERFRRATPFMGVCIIGACFKEEIDLRHIRLQRQLCLLYCRFESALSLTNIYIDGWLSFEGSWFGESVDLSGSILDSYVNFRHVNAARNINLMAIKIHGSLDLSSGFFDDIVEMTATEIEGRLDLSCARFNGKLNMNAIRIGQSLIMLKYPSFKEVDLQVAKIGGDIAMSGCSFDGPLKMYGIIISQRFNIIEKANFKEISLTNAKIDSSLILSNCSFTGKMKMNGISVGRNLLMRKIDAVENVDFGTAKISANFEISGSSFNEKLNLNGVDIGQHLLMRGIKAVKEVDMGVVKINGYLNVSGSNFCGKLNLHGINVGQSLLAQSTNFPMKHKVILNSAKIGSMLDLSGASIDTIDLSSTNINDELRFGFVNEEIPTKWGSRSKLILRNTTVGVVNDTDYKKADLWPENLVLQGFKYTRFGGERNDKGCDIESRGSEWFIKWLNRDKIFSPQPYEQLANVLNNSGYPTIANSIRFEARERSRISALYKNENKRREVFRWFGLTLLKYTIGYGLGNRYFRVLYWFSGLTALGFLLLLFSIDKTSWNYFKFFWASFDQVLPIIELNRDHQKWIYDNCNNWSITYFYFQKLAGYILGGFLGAGLSGLTQKS